MQQSSPLWPGEPKMIGEFITLIGGAMPLAVLGLCRILATKGHLVGERHLVKQTSTTG
jgi:hypothetical protein